MAKGRPSTYTPELAAKILEEMTYADGGLEEVCSREGMPSDRSVYRWLAQHEDFRQAYTRAREVIADVQAARALRDALTATDASLGRLAFDARRWSASKLAPKKYGDAVQMKLTDNEGGPVQQVIRWAQTDTEATPDPSKS